MPKTFEADQLDRIDKTEIRSQSRTEAPSLISKCPAIDEIRSRIDLIAHSSASVFITGESGTGKEVVARLIHSKSGRSSRPQISVNCAALPKDVIENELFGHEREAFTGATSKTRGCFEAAHESTLFLDEISEMHPQVQAKLLRAIEEKSFRRLGGHEDVEVDVRIVAATNRRIPEALESGALRADLYYRLSVVEIFIPPLRDRPEDIPLLVDHFVNVFCQKYGRQCKRFSKECLQILSAFPWPGNVRELRNVVESAVLISPGEVIEPRCLSVRVSRKSETLKGVTIPVGTSLLKAEQLVIERTLEHAGENKSLAARILGVSRKALYDKLNRYRSGHRGEDNET